MLMIFEMPMLPASRIKCPIFSGVFKQSVTMMGVWASDNLFCGMNSSLESLISISLVL